MGFRFFRRVKLAPGLRLNLSKSGGSLSFGRRGARYTVGPRGRRTTFGIPGTGLFYTTTSQRGTSRRSTSRKQPSRETDVEYGLTMGFFRRLFTPKNQEAFVDGCRVMVCGNDSAALKHFERATHLADGALMAGLLALKKERLADAIRYLDLASRKERELGKHFEKFGISAAIHLPITSELFAEIGANVRGLLLIKVEALQLRKEWQKAVDCLRRLRKLEPEDTVVKLSLAELLLDAKPKDRKICRSVVQLAKGIENETAVHTALLLCKARALRSLGLMDASSKVLTAALRRRKGRSTDLLHAVRYERALVYEDLGNHKRSRSDLEKVFADAPDYEDVAVRLGC